MAADAKERVARIHDLDLKYQQALHATELITRDEDTRRVKLKLLSLRDENATLKDTIQRKETSMFAATKDFEQTRAELEHANQAARNHDARMKKQAVEMSTLKAEVEALNNAMSDSGKALQEKFALTRELNRLKPELEHLQSQLTNHQTVIAEKHDLQRQLDSLEVELDNVRRSKQRARGKEDDDARDELQMKLETAEKRLAAEKREKERTRKDLEKEATEANTRCEKFEKRTADLKAKLQDAQRELREAQSQLEKYRRDLDNSQAAAKGASEKTVQIVSPKKPARELPSKKLIAKSSQDSKSSNALKAPPARKRRARELSFEDSTAQTPGRDDTVDLRALKKSGATVGEKSAFSITPFLNRSKDASEEPLEDPSPAPRLQGRAASPELPEDEFQEDPMEVPEELVEEVPESPEVVVRPAKTQRRKRVVEIPDSTAGSPAKKPKGRPKGKGKTLDEVVNASVPPPEEPTPPPMAEPEEPPQQEEQENAPAPKVRKRVDLSAKPVESRDDLNSAYTSDAEGRKKKRKLLGGPSRNLFDEDDAEMPVKPVSVVPGMLRKTKANMGPALTAFGASSFSPRKRERKGVQASFLG